MLTILHEGRLAENFTGDFSVEMCRKSLVNLLVRTKLDGQKRIVCELQELCRPVIGFFANELFVPGVFSDASNVWLAGSHIVNPR